MGWHGMGWGKAGREGFGWWEVALNAVIVICDCDAIQIYIYIFLFSSFFHYISLSLFYSNLPKKQTNKQKNLKKRDSKTLIEPRKQKK